MAGIVDKFQKMWNPPDDEYEEDFFNDFEEEEETVEPEDDYSSPSHRGDYSSNRNYIPREMQESKVVNINAKTQLQVVLIKPVAFGEETRTIAEELIRRHTVVLNLEKTEKDIARRIVDFLSGVAFANNGKIKRIATSTYIITPYNVDLTGDEVLDELENSGLYF
jgi:Uncharacterized protein conserved in bacteria